MTLNIEGEKNFSRFLPFIEYENPDIICLQEVFVKDLDFIASKLKMHYQYAPMATYIRENPGSITEKKEGVAILSKIKPHKVKKNYYFKANKEDGSVKYYDKVSSESYENKRHKVLLSAKFIIARESFNIATTHFTWTHDGNADEAQRRNLDSLLQTLAGFEDIVFCGDFNALRGREIHNRLSKAYIDWVLKGVTTTLDQNLHRVKGLQLVVDGIFSSANYVVSSVKVVSGVSDHCALVADISKAKSDQHLKSYESQKEFACV